MIDGTPNRPLYFYQKDIIERDPSTNHSRRVFFCLTLRSLHFCYHSLLGGYQHLPATKQYNHPTVRQGQMFLLNYLLDRMIRWLTSSASQLHKKNWGPSIVEVAWRHAVCSHDFRNMTYMKP